MSEAPKIEFEPVNELERLLVAAANDAAARPAFYRGLLKQDLFIITEGRKPQRPEVRTLQADESIQLRQLEIDGKPHTPIFTSERRISAVVPSEVGFFAMKGADLLGIVRGSYLVMNPGGGYGKTFTPDEVESILNGSIFQPSAQPDHSGKKILLGQPANYPSHIVEPLKRYFAKNRAIKSAYLAHALIEASGEVPHTVIGLDVDGPWEPAMHEAGVVARESVKPGEIVDFVPMTGTGSGVIGDYMRQKTQPIYQRKKWLGLFG